MDSNKDTKWSKLRARLHMLGYNDNLGEESVQLVEQLFSDLVHTTESLRESQRSTAKSEKESQNSDVRLTREHQELHFELMMVRGERAQVTRELKVYITKLENDVTLLKSLNEQYLHELHSLEKDCKEKAKLVCKLRRKNFSNWVQAVGKVAGLWVGVNNLICASPNADDLLQGELTNLKAELENSQESIRHSNNQMDELQETNMALEQKLKSAQHKSSSKVIELTSKNHELCQEIMDIRNLAKMMEMEKKQKLEKAELKLQDLKEAYNLREQNEKFEAMLEFLEEENSRLQAKVEKMMSVEKVLVLELEGWRTKYGICGLEWSPSRLDAFVQSLEEERDHYRQEVEHYKNIRGRSPVIEQIQLKHDDQQPETSAQIVTLEGKLRLAEEKILHSTTEKDSLKEELKILQLNQDEQHANIFAEIVKLEEKLRLAEEKIHQLTAVKDSLKKELENQQLKHDEKHQETSAETIKLEQKLRLAEEKIQQLITEKDSLKKLENPELPSQVLGLRDRDRNMERQMDARHAGLQETARERIAVSGLRQQQEQIQYALLDLQQMLSVKNNELLATHTQVSFFANILLESLSQQVYQHKQEAEILRISFSALKIRKDVLEEEVVAKTKRLAVLQEQLGKKVASVIFTPSIHKDVTHMDVELKSQERQQATQRLLETHQEALLQIRRDNELIIGEYRRLQDDVAAMTQEKQVAHERMEEALREREELKLRVHSYVNMVSRIENILKTKDQENQDLAERFRSDVQEREQRLQQVEGFIGTVRMELLSSETERQHLHEVLGKNVREIQQHMHDLQTYKAQVATLAQETSQLEEEVRVHQEEKVTLLAELVSVRELCVKMDAEKEIAARQLLLKSMELERAMTREEDALTEAVLIKEHLASEKLVVRNMEAMLSTSRQEMFQAHQEVSEKEAELKALRQKLALADDKIAAHAREVTNLRRKIDHLQTVMEVLSRKGHERNALEDTPSQDVSFRPLRASSPLDHQPASHQPAPDTSIQEEEVRFGLT
ncbi:centrosomal protein of 135 kDa-like [Syngnathus acus]|uniref:centrosomal protein of 135 kDa-like n=1 Tax=Syngnathus acus TaxID=161584 RepID=UPI001885C70B|nr:centrosomal protein of 135 kDa-like [Syngnathus acus]